MFKQTNINSDFENYVFKGVKKNKNGILTLYIYVKPKYPTNYPKILFCVFVKTNHDTYLFTNKWNYYNYLRKSNLNLKHKLTSDLKGEEFKNFNEELKFNIMEIKKFRDYKDIKDSQFVYYFKNEEITDNLIKTMIPIVINGIDNDNLCYIFFNYLTYYFKVNIKEMKETTDFLNLVCYKLKLKYYD